MSHSPLPPIDEKGQTLKVGDEIGVFCDCGKPDCGMPDGMIHTVTAIVDDPAEMLRHHPKLFIASALCKSPAIELDKSGLILACHVQKLETPEVSDTSWSALATATGWVPKEVH